MKLVDLISLLKIRINTELLRRFDLRLRHMYPGAACHIADLVDHLDGSVFSGKGSQNYPELRKISVVGMRLSLCYVSTPSSTTSGPLLC